MDGHLMERESSASFIQKIQSSAGAAVGYLLSSASRRVEFICRFRRCVFARGGNTAYLTPTREKTTERALAYTPVKNVTTTRVEILAKARRCGLHDLIEVSRERARTSAARKRLIRRSDSNAMRRDLTRGTVLHLSTRGCSGRRAQVRVSGDGRAEYLTTVDRAGT